MLMVLMIKPIVVMMVVIINSSTTTISIAVNSIISTSITGNVLFRCHGR